MKKKTILLITDYGDKFGGAEKSFLRLIDGILKNNSLKPVCLFFNQGALYEKIKDRRVDCYQCHVPYMSRPITLLSAIKYVSAFLKFSVCFLFIHARYKLNAVYCNKTVCVPYGFFISWLMRVPCIWHVRNLNRNFGSIGNFIVRHIRRVVFNSHYTAGTFKYAFGESDKFQIVYNGTEIPDPVKVKYVETITHIGMIAHFSVWKNHAFFVKAIPPLLKLNPNLQFYIVGDFLEANPDEKTGKSDYRDALTHLIQELGVEKNIHFTGYQSEVHEMYDHLDLLIHPTENEPFGLVLIEAMSFGIPVIACDSGGPAEIIRHGQTGLLYKKGDLTSLVDCAKQVMNDRKYLRMMTDNALEDVWKRFSSDRYNQEMLHLFDEVLSSDTSGKKL